MRATEGISPSSQRALQTPSLRLQAVASPPTSEKARAETERLACRFNKAISEAWDTAVEGGRVSAAADTGREDLALQSPSWHATAQVLSEKFEAVRGQGSADADHNPASASNHAGPATRDHEDLRSTSLIHSENSTQQAPAASDTSCLPPLDRQGLMANTTDLGMDSGLQCNDIGIELQEDGETASIHTQIPAHPANGATSSDEHTQVETPSTADTVSYLPVKLGPIAHREPATQQMASAQANAADVGVQQDDASERLSFTRAQTIKTGKAFKSGVPTGVKGRAAIGTKVSKASKSWLFCYATTNGITFTAKKARDEALNERDQFGKTHEGEAYRKTLGAECFQFVWKEKFPEPVSDSRVRPCTHHETSNTPIDFQRMRPHP
jgi:hypothetical protein